MKNTVCSTIKIFFSSLGMVVGAYLTNKILLSYNSANLTLIISIGASVIVYFILIYFMKIEEVNSLVTTIRKRLTDMV